MIFRILLFLFLTGFCAPVASMGASATSPALIVQETDGSMFDLNKLQGNVVIVHFWATWCPDCREEMPELDKFYRKYSSKGLEVIALSTDAPRQLAKVKEIMSQYAYKAAMQRDAQTDSFDMPGTLPVTYVIDRTGTLRKTLSPAGGPLKEQDFEAVVLPLLQSN